MTLTNSVFMRSFSMGCASRELPAALISSLSGSSTNVTQCGFPTETAVILIFSPKSGTGASISGAPQPSGVMSRGSNDAFPICTRTVPQRPSKLKISNGRRPAGVSTVMHFLSHIPRAYRYSPTHRSAFPHISPSLPSALNMRMAASAPWLFEMITTPSPPTEKCRGDIAAASLRGLGSSPASRVRSINM